MRQEPIYIPRARPERWLLGDAICMLVVLAICAVLVLIGFGLVADVLR
jgi:hypothetical protein